MTARQRENPHSIQRENPQCGAAGLQSSANNDGPEYVQTARVLQARIQLIREDICDTIGGLQAALDAAMSMADIPSTQGLLGALRLARSCWKSISQLAAELGALQSELASLLRQGGAL